jgi:hypothetical protein
VPRLNPRLWALVPSLAVYAAAVSGRWQRVATQADRLGCVDPHAVAYQAIVLAGLVAGLALGPTLGSWAGSAAAALLPDASEQRRAGFVQAAAWILILVGMAGSLLGIDPSLNLFLDVHRAALVEADLLLYGMGLLSGAGWRSLLGSGGWLGLLLTPAMALMMIGGGIVGSGWC